MELEWTFSKEDSNRVDDQTLGLSIIPVASNKRPFRSWAEYQEKISPIQSWHSHYKNQGTIGIITGKISGNLECIDIDVKNDPRRTIMTEFSDLIPDGLLKRLLIQTTPNYGFHLIYRCPDVIINKSQKLALNSNGEVIIETRGEAGYFCTNKVNNKILQGKLDLNNLDVEIPILSVKEREFLLETARSLTRYFPTGSTSKIGSQFVYSEPAINDFNNKYTILDLFLKHNWKVVREDQDKLYLLREGSSAQYSGYYFKSSKTFSCFSTSTEFKPEKPYNHFQILEILEGKNDYKTTLRLLPSLGFPISDVKKKVDVDDIADYLNGQGVRFDSFIQDLTMNGKVIEELEYNTLFINLKKHFEKEIPRTRFEETIKSNYIQAVNPVLDFIEANKHRQPSGTFEKWIDCMELRNKTVERYDVLYFLKKWYVGMIAQALDAEFPNEFFLSLISTEQGIGKTTLLRNYTLPKELQSYRKEHSLSFDDDFKVLMGQALLIIDDEMDGRTYDQDKTFKTILSIKELTMRRKYDRRITTIRRRASFAGSGNHIFVVRELQNRRVIPIEIQKIHFDRLEKIDLNDLFIEAYNLFRDGFKYSYQKGDMDLLRQLYEDYVQRTDVDLILDEYVQQPETIGEICYITNLDLVSSLSSKFPQFSKRLNVPTIGKLMAERGFESQRKGKKRISCYKISKNSRIFSLLDDNAQSWHLLLEFQLDGIEKNKNNIKDNN